MIAQLRTATRGPEPQPGFRPPIRSPLLGLDLDPQMTAAPLNVGRRHVDRYYVYQDLINKRRVRIHTSDCGHCNDGRGQLLDRSRIGGKWHGPFDYDEVFKVAGGLARPDTRTCRHCMT